MPEHVAILGGSFNPPHRGHLHIARAARDRLQLDRVLLVPTGDHPFQHKRRRMVPGTDRLRLVRLLVAGEPGMEVCDLEVGTPGIDYTIDTVRQLQVEHPEWELHLLVGSDVLSELTEWRQVDELLRRVRLVVFQRPGHPSTGSSLEAGDYALLEVDAPTISSTAVRAALGRGDLAVAREMLTEPVLADILKTGLYPQASAQRTEPTTIERDGHP